MKTVKVAVCQIRTELKYEVTMKKAEQMIHDAAVAGAGIVVLPEMFYCPYAGNYFMRVAEEGFHDSLEREAAWARENHVLLVGGSIPELENGILYNTCYVFDETGQKVAKHRKVHLFDIDLPGMQFRESDTFDPGNEITVFDTQYGKMGVAVCFDVRFPELFRAMANRGAEVIFLPAQFNMKTGPAHWELSLRARAVDNEIFFIGASAARFPDFSYECWGHSMVVDPFGTVLAEADETEQVLYAELCLDRVNEVRQQLPTFLHLREEFYAVAK